MAHDLDILRSHDVIGHVR